MIAVPSRFLLVACALLAAAPLHAQRLAARADLLSVLGSSARTETFEGITTGANVYALSSVARLDANTVFPGRGAGLIEPGVGFSNANNGHWFYPASYGWFGNPSALYAGSAGEMDATFDAPTRAFGVDLRVFFSAPVGITMSVYDITGQLVSATTLAPLASQFFGWQHDAGISRVHFSGGTNDAASVRIDDLTFGAGPATVTPEPATLALLAAGLAVVGGAARRRQRSH